LYSYWRNFSESNKGISEKPSLCSLGGKRRRETGEGENQRDLDCPLVKSAQHTRAPHFRICFSELQWKEMIKSTMHY
jgi:hypothetical protein